MLRPLRNEVLREAWFLMEKSRCGLRSRRRRGVNDRRTRTRLRSFRTRDNRAGEGIDLLYDCAVGERQEIIKLDAEVFVIQQKLLAGKLPAMEVEGLKARLSELLAVRKKLLEDFSRKSGDRIK